MGLATESDKKKINNVSIVDNVINQWLFALAHLKTIWDRFDWKTLQNVLSSTDEFSRIKQLAKECYLQMTKLKTRQEYRKRNSNPFRVCF